MLFFLFAVQVVFAACGIKFHLSPSWSETVNCDFTQTWQLCLYKSKMTVSVKYCLLRILYQNRITATPFPVKRVILNCWNARSTKDIEILKMKWLNKTSSWESLASHWSLSNKLFHCPCIYSYSFCLYFDFKYQKNTLQRTISLGATWSAVKAARTVQWCVVFSDGVVCFTVEKSVTSWAAS